MWSEPDSDDSAYCPYTKRDDDVYVEADPPPAGTTGLDLAQHYFGPLLSPVAATPARWTAYTTHRRGANVKYRNVFDRRKRHITEAVAAMEAELGFENGTLQKCVSVLGRYTQWDDTDPRDADILVRIYSPAAPKYVDVHIKYHSRCRMSSIEWSYSIGFRIYSRMSGSPTEYHDPSTDGPLYTWHSRAGWQSICWGYYDDENNYNPNWRRIEVARMELRQEGVLAVHEALFGPIETPPSGHAEELVEYRRKLVATVRLLLASLGISYEVACTEDEVDRRPRDYTLEGLSDKWVARGIRAACGFQLSWDAKAAKQGAQERVEQAAGVDDDEDDDEDDDDVYGEDEFSDEGW